MSYEIHDERLLFSSQALRVRGNAAAAVVGRVQPLDGAGEGHVRVCGCRFSNRITAHPPSPFIP